MKKKYMAILAGLLVMCSVAACGGGDDVKVVNKIPNAGKEDAQSEGAEQDADKDAPLTGYIFEVEAGADVVSVTTDIEMSSVLEKLGEPVAYFESASCAFNGIDKIYTYDHFRIETYPDGEKDIISSIIFLDDLAETKEGVYIGMTKTDMEDAYGTDYEEKNGLLVYTKDGKYLSFLLVDDVITSIEYKSPALDLAD